MGRSHNNFGLDVRNVKGGQESSTFHGDVSIEFANDQTIRLETHRYHEGELGNNCVWLTTEEAIQVMVNLSKAVAAVRSGVIPPGGLKPFP